MKRIIQLFLLVITVSIFAQDFKPYKVKSGKITYEKLKYSTHSGFSSVNGVTTSYSKQVPYVAEQVIYYWKEYGDIAFEETYKISKFGGELLKEKVKTAERLWVKEHRYYFDFQKNKMYDDPFHLRIECRENFQYYQIVGSWIKLQYMGVEVAGTKSILGREALYYKIDNSTDLYTWNNLVLKSENYYTNREGNKRKGLERAKIAIEIDTILKINDRLFNPNWLKREKLYKSLNGNKIGELIDATPNLLIQVAEMDLLEIQKNDIFLFVTTSLRLGKLQVLNIDDKNRLTIKFEWYYSNNSIGRNRDSFRIKNNSLVNIDNVIIENKPSEKVDFKWQNLGFPTIIPKNNIGVYLLKSSRTNTLKLKPYARN